MKKPVHDSVVDMEFWNPEWRMRTHSLNPQMLQVYSRLRDVAATRSTVLLFGETGVGKSDIAQLIHQHSSRRQAQFIHVHCGAIAESLLESELFGHEKGAFTGALRRKLGKFELANEGTLFLDEVSTLTASAQIKLLQVLQDAKFQRVGGESDVRVDVRIIAATNENLSLLCEQGRFRKDLFYRLNVFPIDVPPLRERREDIPHIVETLVHRWRNNHGKDIRGIEPEALEALMAYPWPGNIRELENLVERAFILEKGPRLSRESFPAELFPTETAVVQLPLELPLAEARLQVLENFERQYLHEILSQCQGRIKESALRAGIGVRQLHKLMKKHSLHKEDFKNGAGSKISAAPGIH